MRYLQGSLALSTRGTQLYDISVAVRNIAWGAVAVIHSFFTRRADTFGPLAIKITLINRTFTRVTGCGLSAFDELHFQYPSSTICCLNSSYLSASSRSPVPAHASMSNRIRATSRAFILHNPGMSEPEWFSPSALRLETSPRTCLRAASR